MASGGEIYEEMCSRCNGEPGAVSSPPGSSFRPVAALVKRFDEAPFAGHADEATN